MSDRTSKVRERLSKVVTNDRLELFFVAPAIITLFALIIFPMLWSIYISFTDLILTVPGRDGDFIGLSNYERVLTSERMWNSIFNTAYYVVVGVFFQFIIGFAIALYLANYVRGSISRALMTLLLLPMMMAPIVAGYMWRLLFSESFGPINYILGLMGLPEPAWRSSTRWALNSIIIADIWQWTPFVILILYTGRLSINEELYEAARVDGASKWFTFRHVTLPQMKGVIAVAILIRAMDAFKFFDKMFVMTLGGPGTSSELATYYNYLLGFENFNMGQATAMSWVLVVIAVILANIFLFVLERGEGGDRVV